MALSKEQRKHLKRISRQDALQDDEVEELISASTIPKEKLVVIGLVYTGMRVSEFSHLHKDWIKWQDSLIQVPVNMPCNCPSCNGMWTPKSETGSRVIPITDARLRTILEAYFTLHDKVGLHRASIFRIVRRVAQRTSIKSKVYPHALRATFATRLAYKGISTTSLMTVMGWGKLETAQHYIQRSGARAIEEIRSILNRPRDQGYW